MAGASSMKNFTYAYWLKTRTNPPPSQQNTHTQVGKRADPFYKFLCLTLKNPNKIARITLNFEKCVFGIRACGRWMARADQGPGVHSYINPSPLRIFSPPHTYLQNPHDPTGSC